MPDQNIIERSDNIPVDRTQSETLLTAPVLKDTRVRIHIDKAIEANNPVEAINTVIDTTKFPQGTEFNVRKFGDKGFAVSARDPKNNSVFEFVYDRAETVKQIELRNNGTRTTLYLNEARQIIRPDGVPYTIVSPIKLPIKEVQDTFKKALEDNGFKFYQEDPEIDKKKGHVIPNTGKPSLNVSTSPIPHNGGKEKLSIG